MLVRNIIQTAAILYCALLVFLSCSPASSAAEPIPTEIKSDTLEQYKEQGVYILRGNIAIKRDTLSLSAEEGEYYEKESKAVLRRNVVFEDKDVVIRADDAEINVDDKTGIIHHANILVKKDNFHIMADRVEKTGEDSYTVSNATLTTCDGPSPPWCFTASGADVLMGDRLKAGNVVFKVKGVPLLYTPYLWTPVLTDRKTGLLFPSFGYKSDLGFFYRQPLFIVLAENRDATITGDYFSKRGFGEGLEYRYVERGDIQGQWNGYHVRDDLVDKDIFSLKGLHTQYQSEGFSHFLNLNLLNDRNFYKDYSTEVKIRTQRFLESTGSVSYALQPVRFAVSGFYWYDLQNKDDTIQNRLPKANISLHPLNMGPLLFSLDADVTNFLSERSYDVQRYSIAPEMSAGIGDTVRLTQTIRAAQSYYKMSNTDSYPDHTDRTLVTYSAGVNTSFFRRFDRVVHLVEPEIQYAYTTDSDYHAPQLDALEAVSELSDVILSLDNRFVDDKGAFFSFRIAQPYDLRQSYHPLKPLRLDLGMSTALSLRAGVTYDYYRGGIAVFNGDAGMNLKQVYAGVGQRYDRENNTLFYTGTLNFSLGPQLSFRNSLWYDAKGEGLRDFSTSAIYSAQCWGLTLTYTKQPGEYSIRFAFELKGLGDFKVGVL
ncbi:MAG: LPS-assembly protein LptD [bacterium]